MTEVQNSSGAQPAQPAATGAVSEAKTVESVASSAGSAGKERKPRTPKQLEVLRRARERRSQNAKDRKRSSGSLARSDGGAEFIDRIARADPETSERGGRSPKRRKRDGGFGGGSFGLSTPKEFAIGALVLGGLALTAFQAKKKTSTSSSAPPPTARGASGPQQPSATLFNHSNVFA